MLIIMLLVAIGVSCTIFDTLQWEAKHIVGYLAFVMFLGIIAPSMFFFVLWMGGVIGAPVYLSVVRQRAAEMSRPYDWEVDGI